MNLRKIIFLEGIAIGLSIRQFWETINLSFNVTKVSSTPLVELYHSLLPTFVVGSSIEFGNYRRNLVKARSRTYVCQFVLEFVGGAIVLRGSALRYSLY